MIDRNAENTAREVVNQLNHTTSDDDVEVMINSFIHQHRTLQQKVGGLFLNTILQWARFYEEGYYDLRNEELCKICKIIKDKLTEEEKVFNEKIFLPTI